MRPAEEGRPEPPQRHLRICPRLGQIVGMSSQPIIPDLGFNSELVLDDIRFAPGRKIEGLEIWKYEHQDDCFLKHERFSDDEAEICNWLEEVSS